MSPVDDVTIAPFTSGTRPQSTAARQETTRVNVIVAGVHYTAVVLCAVKLMYASRARKEGGVLPLRRL